MRSMAQVTRMVNTSYKAEIVFVTILLVEEVCRDGQGSSGEKGREDVRATEKRKLIMGENFRDGVRREY